MTLTLEEFIDRPIGRPWRTLLRDTVAVCGWLAACSLSVYWLWNSNCKNQIASYQAAQVLFEQGPCQESKKKIDEAINAAPFTPKFNQCIELRDRICQKIAETEYAPLQGKTFSYHDSSCVSRYDPVKKSLISMTLNIKASYQQAVYEFVLPDVPGSNKETATTLLQNLRNIGKFTIATQHPGLKTLKAEYVPPGFLSGEYYQAKVQADTLEAFIKSIVLLGGEAR